MDVTIALLYEMLHAVDDVFHVDNSRCRRACMRLLYMGLAAMGSPTIVFGKPTNASSMVLNNIQGWLGKCREPD